MREPLRLVARVGQVVLGAVDAHERRQRRPQPRGLGGQCVHLIRKENDLRSRLLPGVGPFATSCLGGIPQPRGLGLQRLDLGYGIVGHTDHAFPSAVQLGLVLLALHLEVRGLGLGGVELPPQIVNHGLGVLPILLSERPMVSHPFLPRAGRPAPAPRRPAPES
jgi:hypothetical protein